MLGTHTKKMRSAFAIARLVPVVLASLFAMGCASESGATDERLPGSEGEVASTDDEIRASCASPRKYFATFGDGSGTCTPITGNRGRWLPEPLFHDAPADVQTSACAFRWSGARGSRPDRERLIEQVGLQNGLAPACGDATDVSVANVEPILQIDTTGMAGSVGCDVCGIVKDRVVFAVLPPEKILLKQFAVRLSNGKERAFQIAATEGRAVSVTLPAPPRGTKYVQGRVPIF